MQHLMVELAQPEYAAGLAKDIRDRKLMDIAPLEKQKTVLEKQCFEI